MLLCRFVAMVAMQRAMKEMYRAARRFSRRTAATIKIQVQPLADSYQSPLDSASHAPAIYGHLKNKATCTFRMYFSACNTKVAVDHNLMRMWVEQALVRGFLARCEFRRRLAAKREREAAAMRVIAPWALTALHRCRFQALRSPSSKPL